MKVSPDVRELKLVRSVQQPQYLAGVTCGRQNAQKERKANGVVELYNMGEVTNPAGRSNALSINLIERVG